MAKCSLTPEEAAAKTHERKLRQKAAKARYMAKRGKAVNAAYYQAHKNEYRERGQRWRRENPDRVVAKCREWKANNKDRVRATRVARWHRKHAEILEYLREWRRRNPDRVRRYKRGWKVTNPDGYRAMRRRNRDKRRGAAGTHTAADIKDIYRLQNGRCAVCRRRLGDRYHVDHIKAIARGGSNNRRNLQLACALCNMSKQDYDPIDFMRSLGRLL